MKPDYKRTTWYLQLTTADKLQIEELREAQASQGDMEELHPYSDFRRTYLGRTD